MADLAHKKEGGKENFESSLSIAGVGIRGKKTIPLFTTPLLTLGNATTESKALFDLISW